jgi:membrane-bound lytic murein transglycosylase F
MIVFFRNLLLNLEPFYLKNYYKILSISFLAILISIGISSCKYEGSSENDGGNAQNLAIEGLDLPEILKKGKLVVLAENSSTSYFIYRGKKMGFEYEILREFAQEIGVDLEIKTVSNLDEIDDLLNKGEGDLVACNYTVTKDRQKSIDFTEPFLRTSQVLIQRKPDGWEKMSREELKKYVLVDPIQLANKKIYVWKESSYYSRLMHLQEEIGDSIYIQGENGEVSGEDLIEQVADGKIDYTVVEKNIAQVNRRFYDNIDIDLEISVRQKIAFAVRKTSPLLKARINQWLKSYMQGTAFKYTKHKYFELSQLTSKSQDQFSSLQGGKISKYDIFFKREAAKYNWDWKLVASVAYQESKFNPDVQGFGGAYGMMQFMPEVGPKFGVYPNSPADIQIAGGTKKLHRDYESWPEIPDKAQRLKFALASYNAGQGHIKDAQRLAEKHGLNPKKWDNNVEIMVKNLSNREYYRDPVVKYGAMRGAHNQKYVESVYSRYLSYKSSF